MMVLSVSNLLISLPMLSVITLNSSGIPPVPICNNNSFDNSTIKLKELFISLKPLIKLLNSP